MPLSLALSLQTCRLWQSQAAAAEEEAEFPAGGDESMQRERGGGREHINVISPQSSFEKINRNDRKAFGNKRKESKPSQDLGCNLKTVTKDKVLTNIKGVFL